MSGGLSWPVVIDLEFLGRSGRIAAALVRTPSGALVVDCGPASCLPVLARQLRDRGVGSEDLHGLLLTHIHLDHAGAAGTLVRQCPHLKVYVHERGARHLVDPAKLLASAQRLYGDQMDRLWGEFAPVPPGNIHVVTDGAVLRFGGVEVDVAYTAGHASHHVCYRDRLSGVVYAGDTGGIRVGPSAYVLPPTPPPDIDVVAWQASIARLKAWTPAGVFVTHFGLHLDAKTHLEVLSLELDAWDRLAGSILATGEEPSRRVRFVDAVRARMRRQVTAEEVERYCDSMSLDDCWAGLERYWQKVRSAGGSDVPG